MTAKYRFRALAQADLESIWLHAREQWSVSQADDYVEALIQRFDWLAENPALGKPRDDIKQGYFCFPEGTYLIFYIVKNKQIEIIGIAHQRMDIIDRLVWVLFVTWIDAMWKPIITFN